MTHCRIFLALVFILSAAVLIPSPVSTCAQQLFPVRGNPEARDRSYDVLHYKIAVSFDEPRRTVHGTVTTTLVPFQTAFRTLEFDAEEMSIHTVSLRPGVRLPFVQTPTTVSITLDRTYSLRDTLIGFSGVLLHPAQRDVFRATGFRVSQQTAPDLDTRRRHGQPFLVPVL